MKRYLFSTPPTDLRTSIGLLLLRIMFGAGMAIGHGWGKLLSLGDGGFPDPLGIGSFPSHLAAVFAEFFCGLLVAAGFATRVAVVPLIFTMAVAAFVVHGGDPLFSSGGASKEMALLYLVPYVVLALKGPGKYSVDHYLK